MTRHFLRLPAGHPFVGSSRHLLDAIVRYGLPYVHIGPGRRRCKPLSQSAHCWSRIVQAASTPSGSEYGALGLPGAQIIGKNGCGASCDSYRSSSGARAQAGGTRVRSRCMAAANLRPVAGQRGPRAIAGLFHSTRPRSNLALPRAYGAVSLL